MYFKCSINRSSSARHVDKGFTRRSPVRHKGDTQPPPLAIDNAGVAENFLSDGMLFRDPGERTEDEQKKRRGTRDACPFLSAAD
jgi:hypothetical protein